MANSTVRVNKGYGELIKRYVAFLRTKLQFHKDHPEFSGNMSYEDYLSLRKSSNIQEGYCPGERAGHPVCGPGRPCRLTRAVRRSCSGPWTPHPRTATRPSTRCCVCRITSWTWAPKVPSRTPAPLARTRTAD